jgi:hypothetical protein
MTVGVRQPILHVELINAGSFSFGPEDFVLSDVSDISLVLFEVWNVWVFELEKVLTGKGDWRVFDSVAVSQHICGFQSRFYRKPQKFWQNSNDD